MSNPKTPAMVLQEFTVKYKFAPPEFILVHSKTGTHENEFHYKVNVAGIAGTGFGRSKQVAKHNAASKALEMLEEKNLYNPSEDPVEHFDAQAHRNETGSPFKSPVNSIGNLKDLCAENKLPAPEFIEISDVGPPHHRQFTYECRFASITTQATANTKKQAKQLAARDMLEKIRDAFPDLELLAEGATKAIGEAMEKYAALQTDVVYDRTVEVGEFTAVLLRVMRRKGLRYDDFLELLRTPNEDVLNEICDRLEIKYRTTVLQQSPVIVCMDFEVDAPLTFLARGKDVDDATKLLLSDVFETFKLLMKE